MRHIISAAFLVALFAIALAGPVWAEPKPLPNEPMPLEVGPFDGTEIGRVESVLKWRNKRGPKGACDVTINFEQGIVHKGERLRLIPWTVDGAQPRAHLWRYRRAPRTASGWMLVVDDETVVQLLAVRSDGTTRRLGTTRLRPGVRGFSIEVRKAESFNGSWGTNIPGAAPVAPGGPPPVPGTTSGGIPLPVGAPPPPPPGKAF